MRMPTTRVEAFRFTDISPILERPAGAVVVGSSGNGTGSGSIEDELLANVVAARSLEGAAETLVVVDGVFRADLSKGATSNKRLVLGGIENADSESLKLLGRAAGERGGPFAMLNGGVASSAVVVAVAADVSFPEPVHVLYISTTSSSSSESLCLSSTLSVLFSRAAMYLLANFFVYLSDLAVSLPCIGS